MKTLQNLYNQFPSALEGIYNASEANELFFIVTEHILGVKKVRILMDFDKELSPRQQSEFDFILGQLLINRPIQYILNKAYFSRRYYYVDESVLIPRQETEELVHWIETSENRNNFILDIGTGSGCIAVTLADSFHDSTVWAIDVSEKALKVAERNALLLGAHPEFRKYDILFPNESIDFPEFDIIVSNPPYVLESERDMMSEIVRTNEPSTALFVPDDDPIIFYRAILEFAKKHLKTGGRLYFEINEQMAFEIHSLLSDNQYDEIEIRRDLSGKDRFVRGIKKF